MADALFAFTVQHNRQHINPVGEWMARFVGSFPSFQSNIITGGLEGGLGLVNVLTADVLDEHAHLDGAIGAVVVDFNHRRLPSRQRIGENRKRLHFEGRAVANPEIKAGRGGVIANIPGPKLQSIGSGFQAFQGIKDSPALVGVGVRPIIRIQGTGSGPVPVADQLHFTTNAGTGGIEAIDIPESNDQIVGGADGTGYR